MSHSNFDKLMKVFDSLYEGIISKHNEASNTTNTFDDFLSILTEIDKNMIPNIVDLIIIHKNKGDDVYLIHHDPYHKTFINLVSILKTITINTIKLTILTDPLFKSVASSIIAYDFWSFDSETQSPHNIEDVKSALNKCLETNLIQYDTMSELTNSINNVYEKYLVTENKMFDSHGKYLIRSTKLTEIIDSYIDNSDRLKTWSANLNQLFGPYQFYDEIFKNISSDLTDIVIRCSFELCLQTSPETFIKLKSDEMIKKCSMSKINLRCLDVITDFNKHLQTHLPSV